MKKLVRITSIPLSMEKLLGNQLTYMTGFYEVTAVSSDGKKLKEVAEKLGVKHHAVEMTREITPFKDLKSIYYMYRFFRKSKPDIVHSHTPKAGLVGMIAAFLARVPIRLHTVAGLPLLEATGAKRKLLSHVEAFTYAFCTRVYPNSAELKKIIIKERFCKESKLMVIGNGSSNGIDLSHFDPADISDASQQALREKLKIASGDFVFIFVGRMVKDKGVDELISAFKSLTAVSPHLITRAPTHDPDEKKILYPSQIQDPALILQKRELPGRYHRGGSLTGLSIRHRLGKVMYREPAGISVQDPPTELNTFDPDRGLSGSGAKVSFREDKNLPLRVKLLLVGPLEQHHNPILNMTLSEIHRNPHIITTGFVQDVRPYLAISSCLILPSYREGFPNAVLQAGAMGLPSIVTDINGCNEIIEHNNNGLIIPVKDDRALFKAMESLLHDPCFFNRLRKDTRKKIGDKYGHKEVWDGLLAEYRLWTGD